MKLYFSHDLHARHDRKLVKLFKAHKLSGIGAYWCLTEMLHEENGYILLSEIENIAYELRVKPEFISKVLNDFELFSNDSIKFWSESALCRISLKDSKSLKARESATYRWNKDANAMRDNIGRNAYKVNESKVNESKVNINTPEQSSGLFKDLTKIYFEWHENKIGIKPQFDSSDGSAMKQIIKYFATLEDGDENIKKNFSAIFSNFDKWDKFYQGQTRIRQINSNLTNIINTLKNGKANSKATLAGIASEMAKRNYE